MAAEPDITTDPQRNRHLSLVALYEREEDANELLDRLSAFAIDTSDATIVRVDNSSEIRAAGQATEASALPPLARNILSAAIIGGALGFIAGVGLYEIGLIAAPFGAGLFSTAFVATLAGAALGAVIGAITGATAEKVKHRAPPPPVTSRDGFLVVVKVPQRLAEQAETVARRLGAKEIIL
jgi:hypothetical protein